MAAQALAGARRGADRQSLELTSRPLSEAEAYQEPVPRHAEPHPGILFGRLGMPRALRAFQVYLIRCFP
jgi:hypothetical protein